MPSVNTFIVYLCTEICQANELSTSASNVHLKTALQKYINVHFTMYKPVLLVRSYPNKSL